MDTRQHPAAPLKVAIIGFGKMALNHARSIEACPLGQLVAVADPLADQVKISAALSNDVKWFASAAELLAAVKPDVVHIVTPPATHKEIAKLCLTNGAHVYVEKPFTLNVADAEDVLETARRAGRMVCPGHQLLFEAPARALNGSMPLIGKVVHVESYFSFHTVRRSRDGRSPMSPIEQLMDILPHPVYTMLSALEAGNPGVTPELASLEVRAEGEVHALLRAGDATGVLIVTLRGRPIESYLRVIGTNGSLRADFVRGALTRLAGAGASAISVVSNPYREAMQILVGSTRGFASRILAKGKGYPGLTELTEAFYTSIRQGTPPPIAPNSIVDTVRICERAGQALSVAEAERERRAEEALIVRERQLPPVSGTQGVVLVTGGTGMLGRAVVADLRGQGWPVRAIVRRVPPPSTRAAGVEYIKGDLSQELDTSLFNGVSVVVHCAAATAGAKEAHELHTIGATRRLLQGAAAAGVKRFLHVSSIAVLKPGSAVGGPVDERTPVDRNNLARGPYVWAKAEAEREVIEKGPALGVKVVVVRPGPLVDFEAYEPPGRLGRELGPIYLAVGPRSGRLSLCAVHTAAQVIRVAVEDFDGVPPVINLVEPEAPTRAELLSLWLRKRPDLRPMWMPAWVLSLMSPPLKLLQKILRPRSTPVDIAAAFSSERYDATLAAQVIRRAQSRPAA